MDEKAWKSYCEVEEFQQEEENGFATFERQGYGSETSGLLGFLTMPLGIDLLAVINKNDSRPLIFIEGDNNCRRNEKPGRNIVYK